MCKLSKKTNKHFLFVLCIMIVSACIHTPAVEKDYFDINGKGDNLTSTILRMDSVRAGLNCNCVINDKLIFMSLNTLHKYEIYTIKGDSLIFEKNFLNKGRGPYEMKNPSFQYDSHNNRIYLYSNHNLEDKFFVVDLKNFDNLYDPGTWEKKRLPMLYTREDFGILSDTVFLNKNYTKTPNMFSLSYASNKDNHFKCLDFKYPGKHPTLSLEGQSNLFRGSLKQKPGTQTFAYSCYISPYVFIFDIINEQIKNIRYISQVLPVYQARNDSQEPIAVANEYREGLSMFQATRKYIYIGYNNTTYGETRNHIPFKGYPSYYFDRINIFDWDGNFIKRLVLDKPTYFFAVSQDDSYIYASSMDLEQEHQPDQILRFKIQKN